MKVLLPNFNKIKKSKIFQKFMSVHVFSEAFPGDILSENS